MIEAPKPQRERIRKAPWYSNVAMLASALVSLGQTASSVSAEEYHTAMEQGGACTPVCDANGDALGTTCFLPKQDRRGGGELYISENVIRRFQERKAGSSVLPEMMFPPSLSTPWCKVKLREEDISKILDAYQGQQGGVLTDEDGQNLPPLPDSAGWEAWSREENGK